MDFEATRAKLFPRPAPENIADVRALRRGLAERSVTRVHQGWYTSTESWASAHPEERHLMQVIAADAVRHDGVAVVASFSAMVLWDLPLFRLRVPRVHEAGASTDGVVSSGGSVARHRVPVPAEDRCVRHGVACTTLERTVFDVVRTAPLEAAVACADAALRRIAWNAHEWTYDEQGAEDWRERMHVRIADAAGSRGIRQARFVMAFADGRAHLPLESVSRLYLHQLGFAPPRLQVAIPGPGSRTYHADFALDDAPAWGEVDGRTKYHELGVARGATAAEVFDAEKRREDWIRGTTDRRVVRWGSDHLASHTVLAKRLAAFGIRPPTGGATARPRSVFGRS